MATNTGKKPWGFFSTTTGKLLKVWYYKNKEMATKAATRMGKKFDPQSRQKVEIKVKEVKGKAK